MSELAPIAADDYVAIQRLVHRYADAVVHRDGEQWASCWAVDAVWDLGRGRVVEGRAAIVELWHTAMAGMAAVVQLVHNGEVHAGDGPDRATGRWYIDERFRRAEGEGAILLAHYEDAYTRVDGRWLFARRMLQVHYVGAPDLTAEFANTREALHARGATRADV